MTNPTPPSPDYISELIPWPGILVPKIDPSFQIGTTSITLAQLAAAYGNSSYTLPIATTTTLGGIVATTGTTGQFVSGVDQTTGHLLFSTPTGSITSIAGRSGVITLTHTDITDWASATSTFLTTVPVASTTTLGGVKVDGTTIVVNSGTASVGSINISNIAGSLSAATASATYIPLTAVGVTVAAQVPPQIFTSSGTVSANVQLAIATGVSASTITIPITATDGWPLTVKRFIGAGPVTVTGYIDGITKNILLNNPIVEETVSLVYSYYLESWVQVNNGLVSRLGLSSNTTYPLQSTAPPSTPIVLNQSLPYDIDPGMFIVDPGSATLTATILSNGTIVSGGSITVVGAIGTTTISPGITITAGSQLTLQFSSVTGTPSGSATLMWTYASS